MIKYFQPNMNNLQVFQGHQESIRDITWSPNDARFATGSDDGTIKLWNFEMMKEEKTLTGAFGRTRMEGRELMMFGWVRRARMGRQVRQVASD